MIRFIVWIPVIVFSISAESVSESGSDSTTYWMGAYLNRTKVGHSSLGVGSLTDSGPVFQEMASQNLSKPPASGLFLWSEASVAIRALGARSEVDWRVLARLLPDKSLKTFAFRLESDRSVVEMTGEVFPASMDLRIVSSGEGTDQVLRFDPGPVYLAESLPGVFSDRIAQGKEIDGTYLVFEPHQINLSEWEISLVGREIFNLGGEPILVYHIVEDVGGLRPEIWIDKEGRVLKERAPLSEGLGYVSYYESEDQAKDMAYINPRVLEGEEAGDGGEPDLLYATAVPAGKQVSDPESVDRMVVDLWNFKLDKPVPIGQWQRNLCRYPNDSFTEEEPLRLEIRRATAELGSSSAAISDIGELTQKFGHYLNEESLVQKNHPEIRELAEKITADLSSPWGKAEAIHHWMRTNIRTEFRITMPSALEVLRSRRGDCNEQSTLFAALARAAGVPARICTGLVLQKGAFYYHAWNEVLVSSNPEIWLPIDPALHQLSPDATHIKFGEGGLSEQNYLTGLIGKIRAQIVEVDTNDRTEKSHEEIRREDSG